MAKTLTFTKHFDHYVPGSKMFSYPPGVHEDVNETHATAALDGGFATEGGKVASGTGTTGGAVTAK